MSRLPDVAENYTVIEFRLARADDDSTLLTVRTSNFPSESIFKHWEFYWRVTIEVVKRFIESMQQNKTLRVGALPILVDDGAVGQDSAQGSVEMAK